MGTDSHYVKNRAKVIARSAAYAAAHPDRVREYKRRYYLRHRAEVIARTKLWNKTNPDRRKALKDQWVRDNKGASIAATRRWQQAHRDSVNRASRRYQIRHAGQVNYRNRLRELTRKRATPPWLSDNDKLKIKNIYLEATRVSKVTGVKHHVDHIYPLRGKTCCGLHVPWNLQILRGVDNLRKHNKLPLPGGSYVN